MSYRSNRSSFGQKNLRGYTRGRSYGGGFGRGRNRGSEESNIPISKYVAKAVAKEQVQEEAFISNESFEIFNLEQKILSNLRFKKYKSPTKIQKEIIPLVKEGKNVLGISATGSGKTGAFLIPVIQKMLKDENQKLLVLAPTRELAIQIEKEAFSLTFGTKIRFTRIIGGESMFKQKVQLSKNPRIIIATPGRLLDVVKRNYLKLDKFNNIVVDEIDRMLDMGFINDVESIINMSAQQKQMMFFSATTNRKIDEIVNRLLKNYASVRMGENNPKNSVNQDIIKFTDRTEKITILHSMLKNDSTMKAIVFIETKREVDKIEKELFNLGHKVDSIHGDKNQSKRKQSIERFTKNQSRILVATNVAARGIDISDITHVINYDEPKTYDEYIHRIGRTGRNGKTGNAITFVHRNRR